MSTRKWKKRGDVTMGSLAVAYMVGWGFVAAYLGWLGLQQRRLTRHLHEFESREGAEETRRAKSRAA